MAEALIPFEKFCALVGRTGDELRRAGQKYEFLWWERENERSKLPESFIAFDAALDVFAQSCVRTGPNWKAVKYVLPGLQLVLRRVIDSLAETFVEIALFDTPGEFALNAGTPYVLDAAHDALAHRVTFAHILRFPVAPVVELLRYRAKEASILLPRMLAPPVGTLPAWFRNGAAVSRFGGPPINWSMLERTPGTSPIAARLSEATQVAGAA